MQKWGAEGALVLLIEHRFHTSPEGGQYYPLTNWILLSELPLPPSIMPLLLVSDIQKQGNSLGCRGVFLRKEESQAEHNKRLALIINWSIGGFFNGGTKIIQVIRPFVLKAMVLGITHFKKPQSVVLKHLLFKSDSVYISAWQNLF